MRRRSRESPPSKSGLSRRTVLAGLGTALVGGGAGAALATGAYDSVTGFRGSTLDTAADPNAVVGMDIQSPVKKNSRDPLLYFTNNFSEPVDVTLTLQTCTDGTLYAPDGTTGCSVTSTAVPSGNTVRFDIEASVTGTVPFTVDVNGESSSFTATRDTLSESGESKSETWVKKLQGLTPREQPDNDWTVKDVKVEDVVGAENLDRVEFDVREPDGTLVGDFTANCDDANVDCSGGAKYQPNGNPSVEIEPVDNNYQVDSSVLYTLTVTGFDKDGNSDSDTINSDE